VKFLCLVPYLFKQLPFQHFTKQGVQDFEPLPKKTTADLEFCRGVGNRPFFILDQRGF
jgi:hypothetical protein